MFTLKVLGPADWASWRALRLAALAEAPYAFGSRLADWQGEGDREERWRARLSIAGSHNLIALRDREPVGMASGLPTDVAGIAELVSMWVAPSARGCGVGDLLLGAVIAWARGAGAHEVMLSVADGNDAAAALYRRHGFRDTGEPAVMMPDGLRREFVMRRPV